jgi:thiol-disulfide isomerase/thioredoxin
MKFGTVLKALFIICLGILAADIFVGKGQLPIMPKPSDVPIEQQAKELFSKIELSLEKPVQPPPMEFVTTEEKPVNLGDLKGRLVLLNAWATWCAPCVKELPSLQRAKDVLQHEGWQVLAVSVDYDVDISAIKSFVKNHEVEYVAGYWDSSSQLQDLVMQVGGVPVTYILSSDGKILARINGSAEWDHPQVIEFLRNLASNQ